MRKLFILSMLCLVLLIPFTGAIAENCDHSQTVTNRCTGSGHIEIEGNDEYHRLFSGEFEETVCSQCGKCLQIEPINAEETLGRHFYINGVCEDPGCKHVCSHSVVSEEVSAILSGDITVNCVPIEGDNLYHQEITEGNLMIRTECAYCGHQFEEHQGTSCTSKGVHSYLNGSCTECGWVNTCRHENLHEYINFADIENCTITAIPDDDECHLVTGRVIKLTECEDCHETISVEETENGRELRPHSYYDYDQGTYVSVCTECGWVNTCRHENLHEYINFADIENCTITAIPDDDEYHLVTGRVIKRTECEDCHVTISVEETENGRELIPHSYYDYDQETYVSVCTECGRPCTHRWNEGICDWCKTACDHPSSTNRRCDICGTLTEQIPINESIFPDPVFRQYISDMFDPEHRGYVDETDLNKSQWFNLTGLEIQSIRGAEYFRSFDLITDAWKLNTMDLSMYPHLTSLGVTGDQITAIDISTCEELYNVYIVCPNLTNLQMPATAPELSQLRINEAQIQQIDVSGCPELIFLEISRTAITSLNVSGNIKLQALHADNTRLTSIDVSGNPDLEDLSVARALSTSDPYYRTDNRLTVLDVSNNPKLRLLNANANHLNSLDLTHNPNLEMVLTQGCDRLTVLSLGSHQRLKELCLDQNAFSTIDLSGLPELEFLDMAYCSRLNSLDVTHNGKLKRLRFFGDPYLTSLDVSHNPLLEELEVEANNLKTLDVTHNPSLKRLDCYWNPIEYLDLTQNKELTTLEVGGCNLAYYDVRNCAQSPEFLAYTGQNVYYVATSNNQFDLNTITGFDRSRASGWSGGTLNGSILTFTADQVTYYYDCGWGHSEMFTLRKGARKENDTFTYLLNADGTATITGCKGQGNIVIPSKLEGYTVTRLAGNAFSDLSGVISITIPATVSSLGENPNNLLAYVFRNCPDLQNIYVDQSNPSFRAVNGVLYSGDLSTLYRYPAKKQLAEYHIPAETTHIDCSAFEGVKGTVDIYLENRDTSWADFSFVDLENLSLHYKLGGRAEIRVVRDLEAGFEQGGYNPWYVIYPSDEQIQSYQAKADAVIRQVITATMSDREKAQALHNWIINNARYTYRYNDPIGILLYGEGHCEAYAKTFQMLLNKVGITNELVTGTAGGGNHMWNRVLIGNVWYMVDCTWDDPLFADGTQQTGTVSGLENNNYFMISPQRIRQDHRWDGMATDTNGWKPEANGMTYLDADGQRIHGWLEVDGEQFWFDRNGISVTGTVIVGNEMCHFENARIYTYQGVAYTAGAVRSRQEMQDALCLPDDLIIIEEEAFMGLPMRAVIIPDGCESIGRYAFANCRNLDCISVPQGCVIDPEAFSGSPNVQIIYR